MTAPTVGLVGCGRWGRLILRDLVALGAEVHVAVPSAAGQEVARSGGSRSVVSRSEDLPEVDGYVVASPTVTHAEVVTSLLDTGRPVFCEKPLTDDLDAARRIFDRAAERVFVMDKWRYHPGVEELAGLARSGAFGEIRSIRTYRLGWGNPHADVDAVWILLPHDLSMVIEVLGHLPAARSATSTAPGPPAEHLQAVLYDEPTDPVVTCEVSALDPVSRRSLVVVGSEGVGALGDSYDESIVLAGTVSGEEITPESRLRPVGNRMPLRAELDAFLGHLVGGPPPRSSAADALATVERITQLRRLAGLA